MNREITQVTLFHWHWTSLFVNRVLSKIKHLLSRPHTHSVFFQWSNTENYSHMSHFSLVDSIWHDCLFSFTDQYMIHSVSFLPPEFHHLLPVCFVIRLLPQAEQLQYFSCNEALQNSKGEICHIWAKKWNVCTKYLPQKVTLLNA